MVSQFGMSDKIGLAVFPQGEIHPFLGREIAQERKFSEHTAQLIDEEVMAIMRQMQEKVKKILTENQDNLKKIAEKLLKEETLSNEEIDTIMKKDKSDKSD
jgi:cell division protease FtsH